MIFHLCRYGWNHPGIVLINGMPNSFILRAIKQINYFEMVILHASPLESVTNITRAPPCSTCESGQATLHLFHFSCEERGVSHLLMLLKTAEVSQHAMRQGVCSLPWCLTEPCSICIVPPHG